VKQRLTAGRDRGAYYHELFLRGRRDMAGLMVRTRIKGNGMKAASSPNTEPNFYAMEHCHDPSLPEGEHEEEQEQEEQSYKSMEEEHEEEDMEEEESVAMEEEDERQQLTPLSPCSADVVRMVSEPAVMMIPAVITPLSSPTRSGAAAKNSSCPLPGLVKMTVPPNISISRLTVPFHDESWQRLAPRISTVRDDDDDDDFLLPPPVVSSTPVSSSYVEDDDDDEQLSADDEMFFEGLKSHYLDDLAFDEVDNAFVE
jgi:hypothetical protein